VAGEETGDDSPLTAEPTAGRDGVHEAGINCCYQTVDQSKKRSGLNNPPVT